MITFLTLVAIFCYLAAGFLLGYRLFRRSALRLPPRWVPLTLGYLGITAQAVALHQSILTPLGLDLSFFNMLALVAWVITVVVLLATLTKPLENLGIVILPVTAVASILHNIFHTTPTLLPGSSVELDAHILLSILSYSRLRSAAVQAVLLAVQDHHLRNRHPGGFVRALPPLETMEYLLFQFIAVGYVLLTFALLTGAIFLKDIFAQHLVHKTVLSILAWIVFAVLLWGRWRYGWRGRVAIRWTLGGFIALMLAYFGSKMVLELILGY